MSPIFLWACVIAAILICALMVAKAISVVEKSLEAEEHNHSHLLETDKAVQTTRERVDVHETALRMFQAQADHTATVQMLILNHLNLEHQVQPQQDRLVTISDLPDLKKSKERSA
jgi:hypothetical protein